MVLYEDFWLATREDVIRDWRWVRSEKEEGGRRKEEGGRTLGWGGCGEGGGVVPWGSFRGCYMSLRIAWVDTYYSKRQGLGTFQVEKDPATENKVEDLYPEQKAY